MTELAILGSADGFATRERFCTSIALLADSNLYLFDCGEPCAALLFRHGINTRALKALFISHMHHDHIGGLAGVLSSASVARRSARDRSHSRSITGDDSWYRAAVTFPKFPVGVQSSNEAQASIQLLVPAEAIEAIQQYLLALYLAPSLLPFEVEYLPVREGLTYRDDKIHVTALLNSHLSANSAFINLKAKHPQLELQSYSYAVEIGKSKFVFSGDITTLDELSPLLQGAHLLILEASHYDLAELKSFVCNFPLKHIVLTHIHPALEDSLAGLLEKWNDPRIEIAHDGMRIELDEASC